jgi:hypothetical protein
MQLLHRANLKVKLSVYMLDSIYRCCYLNRLMLLLFASTFTLHVDVGALVEQ